MKLRTLLAVVAMMASFAAGAADDPEAVYEKFHRAAREGNLDGMLRHASAARGAVLAKVPESDRLEMFLYLANLLPRSYSVETDSVLLDDNRASLRLLGARQQKGTVSLVKENGEWKVDKADWDE